MIEKTAPEWMVMKRWLEQRIAVMHEQLAAPTCGIKEADHLRGKIMFAREIIATVEPERLPEVSMAHPPRTNY